MKGLLKSAAAIALAAACATGAARAESFPDGKLTIIVPYSAGGATDVLARQTSDKLTKVVDQSVVVQNRAGAGGTLGSTMAAKAEPDGHTLFMGQVSSHGIAPAVYQDMQYDPLADFSPVMYIMSIPNVMVVNADFPADSFDEFMQVAKDRTIKFGSSGVGSSIHLSGEMFKSMTGLNMTHVPFRGSGEAVPALISGDVDVMFDNIPSALPHIRSGDLKALAVTTLDRADALPDVPTVAEAGGEKLSNFRAMSWFGLFTQDNVPEDRVAALHDAMKQVLANEEFQTFVKNRGGTIEGGSREEFLSFIKSELKKWDTVVESAGVKVE